MTLALVAIAIGVALSLVVVGMVSVALVRWARRNRARTAQMMLGTYLEDQVAGVPVDGDDGWLDHFTSWLGDRADSVGDSTGGDCGADGDASSSYAADAGDNVD